MKKFYYTVASSLPLLLAGVSLGQEQQTDTITVPSLVSTSGLQESIVTTIKPWLLIGLALGLGVFALWFGWKMIRRFVK